MRTLRLAAFLVLLGTSSFPLLASSIFITGDVPYGTATTFTDTNNGITATFSSPADPGGFVTAATFFSFGPEILYDPGPAGASDIPLNIGFSQPVNSITMDFATDGSGTFDLSAYMGSTLVGTATATGVVVVSFPEGSISFNGATFNSVVLTSPSTPYFAIGNVDVSSTPEPGSAILMLSGALGVGLFSLLRRSPVLDRKSS